MHSCLDARRRLLAAPRNRTQVQQAHIAACRSCARFAAELAALDRKLIKATRLSLPEGLAERVLLARGGVNPARAYRAITAAAALFISISAFTLLPGVTGPDEPALAAYTVGRTHPAIAAISMVLDEEPGRLENAPAVDAALPAERLHDAGLALKKDRKKPVMARYLGRCRLSGQDCEHLLLLTNEGYVSVILLADEHPARPVLVADRRMAALLSPAPSGAYIVVAKSPEAVRRAQKLFEHS